ncbi:DNA polymerase I [Rhodopirellula halodulae]|uniref:DNA polymerase I n=1 Tax=Rhodopirellula halodulae TaxID=2894198 RepID=UPI001E56C15A|nr:DNA polymerase I [Rhodopirellula sp. JC737]MCC9655862.1 DNA polymerase I [Rhodopirellula sp. JC737]
MAKSRSKPDANDQMLFSGFDEPNQPTPEAQPTSETQSSPEAQSSPETAPSASTTPKSASTAQPPTAQPPTSNTAAESPGSDPDALSATRGFTPTADPSPLESVAGRDQPSLIDQVAATSQSRPQTADAPSASDDSQPNDSSGDNGPRGDRETPEERKQRHDAVRISKDALPAVLQHTIAEATDDPIPDLAGKLVVVVDAHSLIYQVFHALPPMTSSGGLPVSAVYGFVGDMLELMDRKNPDYLIAAFDKSEVTFRNDLYPEYKANRDSMPDELRQQIPLIRQTIDAMGIGIIEQGGYEADDLLATVAAKVENAGGNCLVVTSDKDCRQLISDQTKLYNIRKDQEIDATELFGLWGIRPDQVVDYQALVGDPVDNVPGIALIGPKIAQQLLETHGSLEAILDNAESISGKKRKENLMNGREAAMLSRELVALKRDVESPIPWNRCVRSAADASRVDGLLQEFGFRRLRGRAAELLGGEAPSTESKPVWHTRYQTITNEAELKQLAAELAKQTVLAVDTETTGTHARGSDLVGVSIAWQPGEAVYIPVRAPAGAPCLDEATVMETLRDVLQSPDIEKVGHNLKFDVIVLRSAGVQLGGITMDTMVADYLLHSGGRNHGLDDLAKRRLNHTNLSIKSLIGTGKKQITMDQVPVDDVSPYACEDVDVPIRLAPTLRNELNESDLACLFDQVEMPLTEVLAEMEYNGIHVDADTLGQMSERFDKEIADLRALVFAAAGHEFNLDSPKQLGVVLFEELGLPVIKKTKTGVSTDADVLSQLAVDHEIAQHILQYRQATKLKNTYIDALPQLICEKTGRVHTSFRQDVAATGRLSSSEPNLQNIPIRTEQGKAIRAAFTAGREGWSLLGADYSQIELRVLAHYSGDEALIRAYREDADIHTRVAAEVNGIDEADVTSELRRIAKTINFGIVYGQSPFGLAKTLGIGKDEARDYIELYFQRYAGVEAFMMDTLARCRDEGYVSTMLGRRREIKGVRDLAQLPESKRRSLTEPERIAINMPIQGTAADLIKLAMLRVHEQLQQSDLQARLLLQIHDELLLESPDEELDALSDLVRESMTSVMQLDVPLKVDVAHGRTWADC